MNAPVYWRVTEVEDNGRKVIVDFTLGNRSNKVSKSWDGNMQNFIRWANGTAKQYENEWQFPAPSYDEIQSILGLSGSSYDYDDPSTDSNLNNTIAEVL